MANNIVILQNDPARARNLEASVRPYSAGVFTVHSIAELRKFASRSRIQVGILDLDVVTFQEIASLRRQLGRSVSNASSPKRTASLTLQSWSHSPQRGPLLFRRGSCRHFWIVGQEHHASALSTRAHNMLVRGWGPHFELL